MKYLLDSNTCIEVLRGRGKAILTRLAREEGTVATCTIVQFELLVGAHRSRERARNLAEIDRFLRGLPILPFDDAAARAAAAIHAVLLSAGAQIGGNDVLIAGTAISRGLILVTHNTTEFERIAGLQFEDWQVSDPV